MIFSASNFHVIQIIFKVDQQGPRGSYSTADEHDLVLTQFRQEKALNSKEGSWGVAAFAFKCEEDKLTKC